MGKIGKISSIKKKYPDGQMTIEATLANTYGKNRFPGTAVRKLPYKDANGFYRTGLEDKPEERKRLEEITKLDLSPNSDYYNFTSNARDKVEPVRLDDGDNIFNLDNPRQAITYYWLSAHPTIARSWDAWEAGEYPSSTEFYVNDVDLETDRKYKKDLEEANAIKKLTSLSTDKCRMVARLIGYPVNNDTKYEHVYTQLYQFIKDGVIKTGPYKGQLALPKFEQFANMRDEDLYVSDLVQQAITNNIFRVATGGRLMKGEAEMAKSKEDYIDFLKSKKGQEHLLQLEEDLKIKEVIVK